jgi:hypothetical protein
MLTPFPAGDGKGKQNFVYFILKGQCQMIQYMELAVHEIKRHKYFRLHSEEVPIRSNEHAESYFMQVCLMNRGECFGIGESELKTVSREGCGSAICHTFCMHCISKLTNYSLNEVSHS